MGCLMFFHFYGAWAKIREIKEGNIAIQERQCQICGKLQRRQTKWISGVKFQ